MGMLGLLRMCSPETKQSYVVLRAFDRAGRNLYSSELEAEIEEIVSRVGASSVQDLGPLSLMAILNELALGKMTKPNNERRWTLTDRGRNLLRVQRGFVSESSPELASI